MGSESVKLYSKHGLNYTFTSDYLDFIYIRKDSFNNGYTSHYSIDFGNAIPFSASIMRTRYSRSMEAARAVYAYRIYGRI